MELYKPTAEIEDPKECCICDEQLFENEKEFGICEDCRADKTDLESLFDACF